MGILSAAGRNFFCHDFTDGLAYVGRDRLTDFCRFGLFINGTIGIIDFFDYIGLHHMAAIGNSPESLDHLERRHGIALADAHNRFIDTAHRRSIKQDAGPFAGQFDSRRLAEAKTPGIFRFYAAAHLHAKICHAGINGKFQYFLNGDIAHAGIIPVVDGPVIDVDISYVMVYAVDIPFPRIEGRSCHNRLKGRARFIQIDHGPVLIRFRIALTIFVGIEIRTASHRQDFSCLGIHDDDGGP